MLHSTEKWDRSRSSRRTEQIKVDQIEGAIGAVLGLTRVVTQCTERVMMCPAICNVLLTQIGVPWLHDSCKTLVCVCPVLPGPIDTTGSCELFLENIHQTSTG